MSTNKEKENNEVLKYKEYRINAKIDKKKQIPWYKIFKKKRKGHHPEPHITV